MLTSETDKRAIFSERGLVMLHKLSFDANKMATS